MRPTRKPSRSPDDFENLCKAFEGIAGALHEGHPLVKEDVEEACRLAHDLWPVRPAGKDWEATRFEDARHECLARLAAAADGDMHACIDLEKACHHVGMALHQKGRGLEPPGGAAAAKPWDGARDTRTAIKRLDKKYARYALRPVALPM